MRFTTHCERRSSGREERMEGSRLDGLMRSGEKWDRRKQQVMVMKRKGGK